MNPESEKVWWEYKELEPEVNSEEPEEIFLHIPRHPDHLSDFLKRLSGVIGKPITSVNEVLAIAIEAGFELAELQEEDIIQLRKQKDK